MKKWIEMQNRVKKNKQEKENAIQNAIRQKKYIEWYYLNNKS